MSKESVKLRESGDICTSQIANGVHRLQKDFADAPIKQFSRAVMVDLHFGHLDSLSLFLGKGDARCQVLHYSARKVGIYLCKYFCNKVKITLE